MGSYISKVRILRVGVTLTNSSTSATAQSLAAVGKDGQISCVQGGKNISGTWPTSIFCLAYIHVEDIKMTSSPRQWV